MNRYAPWWFQALIAFSCLGASCVCAQEADAIGGRLQSIFVPAPRDEIRKPMADARRAILQEDFDTAAVILGRIVVTGNGAEQGAFTIDRTATDGDYFLELDRSQGTYLSARYEAARLLASLPEAAFKQYELKYGGEASALLKAALAEGSSAKLAQLARTYRHTQAACEGTLLLARYHAERGENSAAGSLLRSILDSPGAKKLEPELSLSAAAAALRRKDRPQAEAILERLRTKSPQATVRIGEKSHAIFSGKESPVDRLEILYGKLAGSVASAPPQWILFRGAPDRNAVAEASLPAVRKRWHVPLVVHPIEEQVIEEAARSFVQQETPAFPSVQPLAIGSLALFRGPARLFAVDLPTGRRVWEYPWDDEPEPAPASGASNPESVRAMQLRQRVWQDAPYGQISSDGRRLYLLEKLGYASQGSINTGNMMIRIARGGIPVGTDDGQRNTNVLTALDLTSQGKLKWRVPDAQFDTPEPLKNAFFLGPPLPIDGLLYVPAEVQGEIGLFALRAETGEYVWRQPLTLVDDTTIEFDSLRRLGGITPAYAEGTLVCPTGNGAIAAIDLQSRRLVWGFTYPRRVQGRGGVTISVRTSKLGDQWAESAPVLAENRVLVTPLDSEKMYCLDLHTGAKIWTREQREDGLYIAGVRNGIAILVGTHTVQGLRLSDGTPAWKETLDLGKTMPSGRGLLTAEEFYLPVTDGRLLVIEANTGKLKREDRTEQPLGNLAAHGDDFLSLSPRGLTAHYRSDRLDAKIESRLAADPRDSWALTRLAERASGEGKWKDALEFVRRAAKSDRPDSALKSLHIETLLRMLESDFAANAALVAELEPMLAEDSQARSRFHFAAAKGLETKGDRVSAFQAYVKIDPLSEGEAAALFAAGGGMQQAGPNLVIRRGRFIASHLRRIYSAGSNEEREAIDRFVGEQFKSVDPAIPLQAKWFLDRFDFHRSADALRLAGARNLAASENRLEAEFRIARVLTSDDRALAGGAHALAAELLWRGNRREAAGRMLKDARAQFAAEDFTRGFTAEAFGKDILATPALREFPRGRVAVETTRREEGDDNSVPRLVPIPIIQAQSPWAGKLTIYFEASHNAVRAKDENGKTIAVASLNRSDNRRYHPDVNTSSARLYGNLLVLATGYEVLAIDLLRGVSDPGNELLWRNDFIETGDPGYTNRVTRPISNPWARSRMISVDLSKRLRGSVSPITSSGVCFIRQRKLMCVDALSGELQWQREGFEPGAELFGDEEHLFVNPHETTDLLVFRMSDGEQLPTRTIAPMAERWTFHGRNVLSYRQAENKMLELTLTDALTQKELWKETAVIGSQACLIESDEAAVLHADGKFAIRSLRDGALRWESRFAGEPNLQQLYAVRDRDRYYVLAAVVPTSPLPSTNVQALPGGPHVPLVSGSLQAFDRTTGVPVWPAPAIVSQIGWPLDQPIASPLMIFQRHLLPGDAATRRNGAKTSLLCLDKRTGEAIYESESGTHTGLYSIEVDTVAASVRLILPNETDLFRWTEEAAPPAPPIQRDEALRAGSAAATARPKSIRTDDDDPFE